MRDISSILTCLILAAGMTGAVQTQSSQQGTPAAPPAPPQTVPVMDGGAGPCSLELTITTGGKPVAATSVKVHIAYGFAGARRLDLEAYTNNEGKVKFVGLPARVRRPPLEFRASKDQLAGTAAYDPQAECQAKHEVALAQPTGGQN